MKWFFMWELEVNRRGVFVGIIVVFCIYWIIIRELYKVNKGIVVGGLVGGVEVSGQFGVYFYLFVGKGKFGVEVG